MRLFISISIPENLKEDISKIQEELKKQNLFSGKFTEKENLHLTLKFLGEMPEERIDEIDKRLSNISLTKFNSRIGKFGVFSKENIRIIWLELNNVENLQKAIDSSLEDLFRKEERFMSHITIARVKSVNNSKKLLKFLEKINMNSEFNIENFSLMKSELSSKGSKYTQLKKYNLES